MIYPKWFYRLRKGLLILMCCHGVIAVTVRWIITLFEEITWEPPIVQLAQLIIYVPVWLVIELIRNYLRFRNGTTLPQKIMPIVVVSVFILLNVGLYTANQDVFTIDLPLVPILGHFAFSLFDPGRCWYYIPCLILVYFLDWLLTHPKKDKQ